MEIGENLAGVLLFVAFAVMVSVMWWMAL